MAETGDAQTQAQKPAAAALQAKLNQGMALHRQGKLADAERCYGEVLQQQPNHFDALHLLGVIARQTRRPERAVELIKRAIGLNPKVAAAHNNLGTALTDLQRPADALASYDRAIALKPDFAAAHSNRGAALMDLQCPAEALASYDNAIALKPDFATAHSNRGVALMDLQRPAEALANCNKAITLEPEYADAHYNRGNALRNLKRPAEALASYDKAIALKPDFANAYNNRGTVLRDLKRHEEAQASCRKALELQPNLVSGLEILGEIECDFGNFDRAQQLFSKALEIQPDHPSVWAQLTAVRKLTLNDQQWLDTAERITKRPQTTTKQKIRLLYAMGKYCDDVKDYSRAFAFIKQANDTKKSLIRRYEPEYQTELADRIICGYQKPVLIKRHDDASESMRPLFIVGMPRSGTSLLEQIIASHPSACGAGELFFWSDVVERLGSRVLTTPFTGELVKALSTECLVNLDYYSKEAQRVVDKMPGNFQWLGLIHIVFPNARILHSKRNPVDTCLSMYFQNFRDDANAYSYDLKDLAHYYRAYHRLMAHWRNVLPSKALLEVPYEAIVDDQLGWSRKIIEFVGLDWDERCLDFHKTVRRVGTLSNWQVRQPVFRTSKERWRNYEQFVGPLLPLLELHDT